MMKKLPLNKTQKEYLEKIIRITGFHSFDKTGDTAATIACCLLLFFICVLFLLLQAFFFKGCKSFEYFCFFWLLMELFWCYWYEILFFLNSHGIDCDNFDDHEVSSGKIGAYLINLDRATERLNFVMPSISALGFQVERISAIDGRNLSKTQINSIVDEKTYRMIFKMLPEKGTIGCSLSHEKAWRAFLKSDNEFAIIFEDDVKFDPDELSQTIKSVIEKKSLWDIANFETKHRGCPIRISKLNDDKYDENHDGKYETKYLVRYLTNVTHAGCYLINRKAAHELLLKFYPIKMPVDHYFTTCWEFDLRFAGIEPRIVSQKFGNSQIKTLPPRKIKTPWVLIVNAIYSIHRAVFHFTYNILCVWNIPRSDR
jgi:glycosyl transferase family 25